MAYDVRDAHEGTWGRMNADEAEPLFEVVDAPPGVRVECVGKPASIQRLTVAICRSGRIARAIPRESGVVDGDRMWRATISLFERQRGRAKVAAFEGLLAHAEKFRSRGARLFPPCVWRTQKDRAHR